MIERQRLCRAPAESRRKAVKGGGISEKGGGILEKGGGISEKGSGKQTGRTYQPRNAVRAQVNGSVYVLTWWTRLAPTFSFRSLISRFVVCSPRQHARRSQARPVTRRGSRSQPRQPQPQVREPPQRSGGSGGGGLAAWRPGGGGGLAAAAAWRRRRVAACAANCERTGCAA